MIYSRNIIFIPPLQNAPILQVSKLRPWLCIFMTYQPKKLGGREAKLEFRERQQPGVGPCGRWFLPSFSISHPSPLYFWCPKSHLASYLLCLGVLASLTLPGTPACWERRRKDWRYWLRHSRGSGPVSASEKSQPREMNTALYTGRPRSWPELRASSVVWPWVNSLLFNVSVIMKGLHQNICITNSSSKI